MIFTAKAMNRERHIPRNNDLLPQVVVPWVPGELVVASRVVSVVCAVWLCYGPALGKINEVDVVSP